MCVCDRQALDCGPFAGASLGQDGPSLYQAVDYVSVAPTFIIAAPWFRTTTLHRRLREVISFFDEFGVRHLVSPDPRYYRLRGQPYPGSRTARDRQASHRKPACRDA